MLIKGIITARWARLQIKSLGISFWFPKHDNPTGILFLFNKFAIWHCIISGGVALWALSVKIFMHIKDTISPRWAFLHHYSIDQFTLINQSCRVNITWHYLRLYWMWAKLLFIFMQDKFPLWPWPSIFKVRSGICYISHDTKNTWIYL